MPYIDYHNSPNKPLYEYNSYMKFPMKNIRLRDLKYLTLAAQILHDRRILSTVTKVMKLWRNALLR